MTALLPHEPSTYTDEQLIRLAPHDGNPDSTGQQSPGIHHSYSPAVPRQDRPVRPWPLLIMALPAAVAVWSGWVGIGQMTGFGQVHPLPGLWPSFHLNTAITLPVGVEAYAAYALRAWLAASTALSLRTRAFARHSAIASLLLGMAGQIAYHLLTQAHTTHAPWAITTAVSCLPVLVLGMGAALTHLLHADTRNPAIRTAAPGPDQETDRSQDHARGHDHPLPLSAPAGWPKPKPPPHASPPPGGASPAAPCAPPESAPPTPNSAP
jgi:hypothetical protein